MKLTRYEQETIINFNAGDQTATLYTRDPVVMRQLDALVTEYPDIFKCVGETDIDKTYSMPKSRISYRKPRRISAAKRQQARDAMKKINECGWLYCKCSTQNGIMIFRRGLQMNKTFSMSIRMFITNLGRN